jgi:uncharacterized protein
MPEIGGAWTLITGATTGSGYEIARSLAAKGENLVLVCCSEERLCQVARELNELSDIIIMPVDMSKPGSSIILFKECDRLGLKIKKLFNFSPENN